MSWMTRLLELFLSTDAAVKYENLSSGYPVHQTQSSIDETAYSKLSRDIITQTFEPLGKVYIVEIFGNAQIELLVIHNDTIWWPNQKVEGLE
jgi:hypothetical protein